MSFSSEVKEELNKLSNLANKEAVKYEWLGYLTSSNATIKKSKVKFSTENEHNIGRFGKLLVNMGENKYEINITGKVYNIVFTINGENNFSKVEEVTESNKEKIEGKDIINKYFSQEQESLKINKEKFYEELLKSSKDKIEIYEKSFIRGAFLGSGSINNPENKNHLEILLSNVKNAEIIMEISKKYQINFKILPKKNEYAVYTKDGEDISRFLALIGANSSVLKYEDIRVFRQIRNNVNRKVNCETANLNKTVDAAIKQVEDIKYLKQIGKFESLPEHLKEIAELRIKNPEVSLAELGKLLQEPIGKSGVNHRLKAIEEKAENLRKK